MRIDSHQHFWKYSPAEYPWIGEGMERLALDYLPEDLQAAAQSEAITGSVAVQARQSLAESRWLLQLADQNPFLRGVVGWVDLRSENVRDQLADLAKHPRFVGVRHVVQDEPDPQFLLGDAFVRGLRLLRQFDLTYDLLLFPAQLPAAARLVGVLPEQPFVLDHLAKPRIKTGQIDDWRGDLTALAQFTNVCCKISGLVTEAAWRKWKLADFRPYLEIALDAFGPGRLMFGSDWPVCLLSGEYAEVAGIVRDFTAQLSSTEQEQIWGGTAARFYNLPVPP